DIRRSAWAFRVGDLRDDSVDFAAYAELGGALCRTGGRGGTSMRFGVLGPIAAWDGDQQVRVGGPRERKLLAALLLHANRGVPDTRLAAVLWGQQPPATAKAQIHNSAAKLRRALATGDGRRAPISRSSTGLVIRVADDDLDAALFARHVAEADRMSDPVR